MVTPVPMGGIQSVGSALVSHEACASSGLNYCRYDACYGGPSGPKGYELYPSVCSERDTEME